MPGGVCTVLDYDVELMIDYVCEMATRIVRPQPSNYTGFRKFVSQLLVSTRLPSTTILLSMNYLAKRINTMHAAGQTEHTEAMTWRSLTVALLLGSKFLDDNTFQNKSWSEVSGIPVKELNSLEMEWLTAIHWCLHVNLDESSDYNAWLANWQQWLGLKRRQQMHVNRERLAALVPPIETDVSQHRDIQAYSAWHVQQVAEYERYTNDKRIEAPPASAYCRDQTWRYSSGWPSSVPLTPPDSGYATPEHVNSATSLNSHYDDWFDRAIVTPGNPPRQYQQPTVQQGSGYGAYHLAGQPSRHSTYQPYYGYGHSIWGDTGHGNCMYNGCAAKHPPISEAHGHSHGQPVAG